MLKAMEALLTGTKIFELEITGPEYSADPDRVFAGNVETQLQELGWQAYEGENFKCTVSRDGLKDGSVAALLCRSFYVYNLHESEIDGPKITVSECLTQIEKQIIKFFQ